MDISAKEVRSNWVRRRYYHFALFSLHCSCERRCTGTSSSLTEGQVLDYQRQLEKLPHTLERVKFLSVCLILSWLYACINNLTNHP